MSLMFSLQVINTSKEMMCYSDFPIPENYPVFMHNRFVINYFRMYAEQFDLKKYIRLQTEVNIYIACFS